MAPLPIPDPESLITFLLGGGGVLIVRGLWDVLKERRAGQLANEGTTIGMYRHIADREEARRKEAEAELVRVKRELRWFRANYASLWQTYKVGPPPGEREFPFGPPEDLN